MKFAVESWSPDYGASSDDAVLAESDAVVDAWVERSVDRWEPIRPAAGQRPPASMLFIDGVRRVESVVWITGDDGLTNQGICASYAAGAVRCNGSAEVVQTEVRRGLFCPAEHATAIETHHGRFELHAVANDEPINLSLALQRKMGDLEGVVAAQAGTAEVVVVDGPLKVGQDRPGFVGFIKTHRRSYGETIVQQTIGRLDCRERTPLLVIDAIRPRYSWYQRLPCEITHGWAGIVRLETPTGQPVDEVIALADQLTATLPRFSSSPHKDPRAPQNLVPIGGLERELRRRLGDPQLLLRALRVAAG